ncbi:MAG: hypothetical protein FD123_3553 [Bacteroidetes bacterium]|nr:MAG: hypothetical protein FD123_3553 [Bacteroidota bacterium]
MDEILSKRIILLTNVLIALCGLGFIALVHRIDSAYKAKEYFALNRIRSCVESIPQGADDPELLANYAQSWLEDHQHDALDKKFKVAAKLSEQIEKAGFGQELRGMKTLKNGRNSGFRLVEVRSEDKDTCCHHGLGNLDGSKKLLHFVEQYRHLLRPVSIRVATGVNENAFHDAISGNPILSKAVTLPPAIPEEVPAETGMARAVRVYDDNSTSAKLKTVSLVGDSCDVSFELVDHMQVDPDALHERFAVTTEIIRNVTLLELLQIDPDYKNIEGSHQLKKLLGSYGNLPMDNALDLVGNDYMEAYESIDIFGFTFSTTSLPIALLLFQIFISTGLFLMVRDAEKRKLKVLSEYDNEEITDYFIKRKWFRILLWLLVPLLSVYAALPEQDFEPMKLYFIIGGACALGGLNVMLLVKAKKL